MKENIYARETCEEDSYFFDIEMNKRTRSTLQHEERLTFS